MFSGSPSARAPQFGRWAKAKKEQKPVVPTGSPRALGRGFSLGHYDESRPVIPAWMQESSVHGGQNSCYGKPCCKPCSTLLGCVAGFGFLASCRAGPSCFCRSEATYPFAPRGLPAFVVIRGPPAVCCGPLWLQAGVAQSGLCGSAPRDCAEGFIRAAHFGRAGFRRQTLGRGRFGFGG